MEKRGRHKSGSNFRHIWFDCIKFDYLCPCPSCSPFIRSFPFSPDFRYGTFTSIVNGIKINIDSAGG